MLYQWIPSVGNPCDNILGTWQNEDGRANVEIYRIGQKYYGKLVWLKYATRDGKPKTDWKNPDPDKRSRQVVGMVIMRGFICESYNTWAKGKIYDPDSGNDYSCKLKLHNHNSLEVRGFIGITLIGRTDMWKRVEK